MKKKLLSTLLCAAMAVSMLAGCGGSDSNAAADNSTASDATETTASADNQASGEDVTIEFWTIDLKAAFGDFFNDMIAQYESENPGVTVNWTDVPYGDIQSKLVTSVAGGAAPDVVNLNTQFTLTLAGQGALVDLNKEATDEQKSIYIPDLWDSAKIGDSVYAFPWYASPDIMFDNQNGSFMFTADLLKRITIPCEISFVKLASYQGVSSTGVIKEVIGINEDLTDRTVVIVEDIVDTGLTMQRLLDTLGTRGPREIHIASLLVKPDKLKVDLNIE